MTSHGQRQLLVLSEQLSERDHQILLVVDRFRLLQAEQIRRLFFHEISTQAGSARLCRRALARLTATALLHRLERRIGGIRAGSSGHVYALAATGRRLLVYRNGHGVASDRGPYEPSRGFVAHRLAIADLYLQLVEAQRHTTVELLSFESEPHCWRSFNSGGLGGVTVLKPDAYVEVAQGEYEHANFVEVDLATAGRAAVLRKLHSYLAYQRTGREQAANGWFPRVVWITTTSARASYLTELVKTMPHAAQELFSAGTGASALALLLGETTRPAEEAAR